jgi:hypothetical protein
MKTEELEDLKGRITPGPWTYDDISYISGGDELGMVAEIRGAGAVNSGKRPEHSIDSNAELIALAPQLLDEVLKLRKAVSK